MHTRAPQLGASPLSGQGELTDITWPALKPTTTVSHLQSKRLACKHRQTQMSTLLGDCSLHSKTQMELGLLSGDQLVPGRGSRISEEPDIREEMPSLEVSLLLTAVTEQVPGPHPTMKPGGFPITAWKVTSWASWEAAHYVNHPNLHFPDRSSGGATPGWRAVWP